MTGYTGYSGDTTKQSGHYLAFKAVSSTGGSVYASWDGSAWNDMTSDGYMVARVDGHSKLYVKGTVSGKDDNVKVYDLSELVLKPQA